ncbi:GATA transcription factor 9 [Forsythia ovata]|uniref:GATA transcription factor n=1 Tax=Forsythia ovata TaxID=205694 RepID=A0ABD1WI33_9LAMI
MENPEFFQGGYYTTQFTPEKPFFESKSDDRFVVEDLLDFPNDDGMVAELEAAFDAATMAGASTDSSTLTVINTSSNSGSTIEPHFAGDISCRSFSDGHFSSELCVPYEDLAELEWLSNFGEESFSSEELQKLQLIQGMKAQPDEASETHQYQFQPETTQNAAMLRPEMSIPAKARSKRSRGAPANWASRLLAVSPTPLTMSSPLSSDKIKVKFATKKKEVSNNADTANGGGGRKCLHCATDKTPQWRTGPMGPKTLCNACGVRYKSGRLVPEYRPAASPTFVLTKHSNSHRKVLELRRQKELQQVHLHQHQFLHQNTMFDASDGDDYLIHQHIGPDIRQLI